MVGRSEGWRPRDIMRSLATIGNLQSSIQGLQNQLTNLRNTIGEENRSLNALRSQVQAVQSQLTLLLVSVNAARGQLEQLRALTVQEQLQRQTVDVFFRLLSDPSAVTDAQLQRFMEQIMAVCMSSKLTMGLPINYTPLKEEMLFLVEAVLGKRFISRETHEAEVEGAPGSELRLASRGHKHPQKGTRQS